jgi:hypothetical protein
MKKIATKKVKFIQREEANALYGKGWISTKEIIPIGTCVLGAVRYSDDIQCYKERALLVWKSVEKEWYYPGVPGAKVVGEVTHWAAILPWPERLCSSVPPAAPIGGGKVKLRW